MSELLNDLDAGRVAPVYYLAGEPYPVDQVLRALRRAVLRGDENDFNLEMLSAAEVGIASILATARTLPMFGGQRLVIAREADKLSAEDNAQLLAYVKKPNPQTCLVLVAAKVDARQKAFVQLKKEGMLHRFEPLKDRQAPAWLTEEARRLGVALGPGAAERIVDSVGADMGRLALSLEQLSLYMGPGQPVTVEAVEELLAETRTRSIFELTSAVGSGRRREALQVLGRMLAAREPGVLMVGMLARLVRQLWTLKAMSAQRASREEMAARAGVHPFFLNEMREQASRISDRTLEQMHRALFRADWALKSSRLPDGLIMQKLVLDLCPAAKP